MDIKGKHAATGVAKTKKIAAAIAAAAACCALIASGTLAFYTAEDRAHNVITSGNVDIELYEWADADKTVPFPVEEGVQGVMPGETVTKVVEVENTGQAPAWVRVRADVAGTLADGTADDGSILEIDFDDEGWTLEGGWWHYNAPLAPGETTSPLFTGVTFPGEDMGNAYQLASFEVDVLAQAVQSDNNGAAPLEADGWPVAE